MAEPAPIALFGYNRPEHTARAIEALAKNDLARESELNVFCDGAAVPEDETAVGQVREVARRAEGFREVRVVERDRNLGLAQSLISGISETLEREDRIIVLEDDLVTSPHFLRFMNDGLERFAGSEKVLSVCGYRFPVEGSLPDAYFLPGAFCWGWATWRRGWDLYEYDDRRLLEEIDQRDLIYEFDFMGSDPLTKILQQSLFPEKEVDSWALRWMGTACIHGMFGLYPGQSLIQNEGFDGSGRHAGLQEHFSTAMAERPMVVGDIPLALDDDVISRFRDLYRKWRVDLGGSVQDRIYYKLVPLLPEAMEKRLYNAMTRLGMRRREKRRPPPQGHVATD